MLEQFSALIEMLYAAAADPALWQDALRAVEDYTGSTGAVLNLVPVAEGAMPLVLAGSFSEDDCAHYALNYMWRCPRIAFGQSHPDISIHYDSMILSEYEMDRDPTYEWYGKHGLRYYVAGWIGQTATHRAYMSIQRSRRQGHADPENVEQFALVLKHMEQALSLAVKLGTLTQQSRFNLALIDQVRHAIFALDKTGRIIVANAKAEKLLVAADALVVRQGRLECSTSSQQAVISRLIEAAIAPSGGEPRGGWTRLQRNGGQSALIAFVAPLPEAQGVFGPLEPEAVVIISDPAEGPFLCETTLHELFGLTPAEARLANALSGGHSIESAAAAMGIQPVTARSELKTIFRKVGVNRQQDLVRLLASLPVVG